MKSTFYYYFGDSDYEYEVGYHEIAWAISEMVYDDYFKQCFAYPEYDREKLKKAIALYVEECKPQWDIAEALECCSKPAEEYANDQEILTDALYHEHFCYYLKKLDNATTRQEWFKALDDMFFYLVYDTDDYEHLADDWSDSLKEYFEDAAYEQYRNDYYY